MRNTKTSKSTSATKPIKAPNFSESGSKTSARLYQDARPLDEAEGLPLSDIPRHLGVNADDENELDEGLVRAGAGDVGPTRDEEDLEEDESDALDKYGV